MGDLLEGAATQSITRSWRPRGRLRKRVHTGKRGPEPSCFEGFLHRGVAALLAPDHGLDLDPFFSSGRVSRAGELHVRLPLSLLCSSAGNAAARGHSTRPATFLNCRETVCVKTR